MATTDFGSSSASTEHFELTLGGEIDVANATDWLPLALATLAACEDCLTVDLSRVTFIDSTGIGMLLDTRTAANEAGKRVRLRGTPERVHQLLKITGLAEQFEYTDDRQES